MVRFVLFDLEEEGLMLNAGEHAGIDQPDKLDPEALAIAYSAVADLLRRLDEDQR